MPCLGIRLPKPGKHGERLRPLHIIETPRKQPPNRRLVFFTAWTLLRSALTLFLSSSPSTLRKCTSIYTRSPAAYRTVHGLEVGNQTSHFFLLRKRRRYRCLDKISWGVIQISYQEYGEVVGVVFRFAMSPFPSIFDAHFPSSHTLPFVTCTVLPESLLLALMTSIVYRVGFVILDT